MRDRLVSIAINNFNYGRFLGDAIESALAQHYPHVEVIVVDDGSTDDSHRVIDRYRDRVVTLFKENGGMASTHNAAFERAEGDVVIFLDADDTLLPTAAERAARAMTADVSNVHWPMWIVDAAGRRSRVEPEEPLPEGDLRPLVLERGPYSHRVAAMSGNAWSRSFLERALPMPEEAFRTTHTDSYLSMLAPLDGEVRVVREPQAHYRIHGRNIWAGEGVIAHARRILSTYPTLADVLVERLRREGAHPNAERWKERNEYYQWLVRTDAAVTEAETVVPPGAAFVLVDDDEWGATSDRNLLPGRTFVPFLVRGGIYWGPPADDEIALAALQHARGAGADIFLFPWFTEWWLDHYRGFAEALRTHFPNERRHEHLVSFAARGGP
ncbi:MAG TPA: glycosyltransferase [Gaiellaceae bacterium]|nr:glycosyltransferase [Gaiellaceae bacterium]